MDLAITIHDIDTESSPQVTITNQPGQLVGGSGLELEYRLDLKVYTDSFNPHNTKRFWTVNRLPGPKNSDNVYVDEASSLMDAVQDAVHDYNCQTHLF